VADNTQVFSDVSVTEVSCETREVKLSSELNTELYYC
ncbi:unnamed protein product, partial [Allacma fusca]